MNTARKGRNTKNRTHRVLVTPDTEWSRNRSVRTWNKTMSQMKRKKNHSTDQKMSPNETSATITVSSLSRWASGASTAAAEVIVLLSVPRAGDARARGSDRLAQVPPVGGDGPDHEDVQGDDEQRPERVVGDEQEVGDGAEHGQGDGRGPGPGAARQQPPAGEGHQQAEQQVDPAPAGGVELEQVVAGGDIELVLEDRDEALQRLPDADHDHRGEQNEAHRPAAGGLVWPTRRRILRRPLLSHLPLPSPVRFLPRPPLGQPASAHGRTVVLHPAGVSRLHQAEWSRVIVLRPTA